MVILFILCGLALLAVLLEFILFSQEKKRNEKRRAAMIKMLDNLENRVDGLRNHLGTYEEKLSNYENRMATLEKGIVPDYEKARQAVDEVNKFNEGLSNMLGFDPMASLKQARNGTGGDR